MALGKNLSAVQFDNLFCDGKTEACSSAAGPSGGIQAEELFKDPLQFFRGNGAALVFYGESQNAHVDGKPDIDDRVRKTVVDRISQKVVKDTLQFVRITEELQILRGMERIFRRAVWLRL